MSLLAAATGACLAASATFAARRDFELLKLLSTADPSVIAVARQLGASFDVSSAEHVPADKGAAKRATPARGADSGAAASSATPRKRRKRVVSEAQQAKKDANFKAKMAKVRSAESHWLRRFVYGWAAVVRAARAAADGPHEQGMPLAPEAGAKRGASDALAGAKATPAVAPPQRPRSVDGALNQLRSLGAAAVASAAAVARLGPGREYARVDSRSRSRSRSRSPPSGSEESSGDDSSGCSGDG